MEQAVVRVQGSGFRVQFFLPPVPCPLSPDINGFPEHKSGKRGVTPASNDARDVSVYDIYLAKRASGSESCPPFNVRAHFGLLQL